MHVIFVCAEFPIRGRATGGFGSYVDSISRALVANGAHVSIICHGKRREKIIDANRKIIVLAEMSGLRHDISIFSRIISFINYPLYFSFQAAKELHAISRREKVDIIEGGDFGAELFFYLIYSIAKKPRVIIKLHTPSFVIRINNEEPLNFFYRVLEQIEKMVIQRAHHVYSPTNALAQLVAKQYKVHVSAVIPYPTKNIFKNKSNVRQSNIVLYVGKLQKKKGVFDLVESIPLILKKNPRSKFVFIGPDTYSNSKSVKYSLAKRIRQLNVESSVDFIESVSQVELAHHYSLATLLVCPSHWENFPNVILEAGSHNLPVIATAVGGIPEMVLDQKNILLIPPKSPKQLANMINKMLNNNLLRKKLAENFAYRLSHFFAPNRIAKDTLNFYGEILKSSRVE